MPSTAGLGIDIWQSAGARAHSTKRCRPLHPSGQAANRDRRASTPDRRFRGDRVGTAFLCETIPVSQDSRTERRSRTKALRFPLEAQNGKSGASRWHVAALRLARFGYGSQ